MIILENTSTLQSIKTRCRPHESEGILIAIEKGLVGAEIHAAIATFTNGEIDFKVAADVSGDQYVFRIFSADNSMPIFDSILSDPLELTFGEWISKRKEYLGDGFIIKEIFRGLALVDGQT